MRNLILGSAVTFLSLSSLWAQAPQDAAPGRGATASGLSLSLSFPERADAPRAASLELAMRNTSHRRLTLVEPLPLTANSQDVEGGRSTLRLSLRHASGRESPFELVLSSIDPLPEGDPKTVRLEPGDVWLRTYGLDSFYFWGPSGPFTSLDKSLVLRTRGSPRVFVSARLESGSLSGAESGFVEVSARVDGWVFPTRSRYPDVEAVYERFQTLRGLLRRDRRLGTEQWSGLTRSAESIVRWLNSPWRDHRISNASEMPRFAGGRLRSSAGVTVPALMEYLRNATDDRDRLAALLGLEVYRAFLVGEAEATIEQVLESEHFLVRSTARRILGGLRGQPIEVTAAEETYDGKTVSEWIAELRKQGVPTSPVDVEAQRAITDRLERMGSLAVPDLLVCLGDEDERVAGSCRKVLARLFVEGEFPAATFDRILRAADARFRRRFVRVLSYPDVMTHGAPSIRKTSTRFVVRLARDVDSEVRREAVLALGSQVRFEDLHVVPHLIRALEDPEAAVRKVAATSLEKVNGPTPAIRAALRRVTSDSDLLVRAAARAALVTLGEDPAQLGTLTHAARTGYNRAQKSDTIETVAFSDAPVPPVEAGSIIFVIDRSASSALGIFLARRYVPQVVESLDPTAEFAVVLADDRVMQFPRDSRPAPATAENAAAVSEYLESVGIGKGSCPLAGYEVALELARKTRARKKAIVYIGDGGSTCPGREHSSYLEEFLATMQQQNDFGCEFHALGVPGRGQSFFGYWLHYLASASGGTYRRVLPPVEGELDGK